MPKILLAVMGSLNQSECSKGAYKACRDMEGCIIGV